MALVACLVVMIVLKMMQQIVHVNTYKRLEIQFVHRNETLKYIRDTFDRMEVKILDQDFHADNTQDGQNIYTNVYTLSMPGKTQFQDLITILSEHLNIRTVRTRNVYTESGEHDCQYGRVPFSANKYIFNSYSTGGKGVPCST